MRKIITIVFLALLTQGNDALSQWVQVVDPGSSNVSSLIEFDGYLFAGTGAGVFYSTNDGMNWIDVSRGLSGHGVTALAVIGENIFAGTYYDTSIAGILFLSTNGGKDWNDASKGLPGEIYALGVSGENLFAGLGGSYDPVYRTADNGTTWIDASGTPITPWTSTWVSSFTVTDNYIFTGLIDGGVMLSTDNGATWNSVSNGLPSGSYASISALVVNGGNVFVSSDNFGQPNSTPSGVYRSTDSGANWTAVNNGLTDTIVNALISYNGNLFAGTNTGAYLSTNNGESWQNLNEEGKPEFNAQTLLVHDGYLFAGGYSELWRRPFSDLNLSSVAENAPAGSGLRVFPNPFSQSTQITFTSQSAGYAEVSIVNMLGVEVTRLFSGELGAGEHYFTWDAGKDAYTTGIYECLIRMNGQVETLPVVLMH